MLAWFFLMMCVTDIFVAQAKQVGPLVMIAVATTVGNILSFGLTKLMKKSAGHASAMLDSVIAVHFLTCIFSIVFFIYLMLLAKGAPVIP